jgi:hypothetical protein
MSDTYDRRCLYLYRTVGEFKITVNGESVAISEERVLRYVARESLFSLSARCNGFTAEYPDDARLKVTAFASSLNEETSHRNLTTTLYQQAVTTLPHACVLPCPAVSPIRSSSLARMLGLRLALFLLEIKGRRRYPTRSSDESHGEALHISPVRLHRHRPASMSLHHQ